MLPPKDIFIDRDTLISLLSQAPSNPMLAVGVTSRPSATGIAYPALKSKPSYEKLSISQLDVKDPLAPHKSNEVPSVPSISKLADVPLYSTSQAKTLIANKGRTTYNMITRRHPMIMHPTIK